jgi:uncharacterized protein (UPF0333 family)
MFLQRKHNWGKAVQFLWAGALVVAIAVTGIVAAVMLNKKTEESLQVVEASAYTPNTQTINLTGFSYKWTNTTRLNWNITVNAYGGLSYVSTPWCKTDTYQWGKNNLDDNCRFLGYQGIAIFFAADTTKIVDVYTGDLPNDTGTDGPVNMELADVQV